MITKESFEQLVISMKDMEEELEIFNKSAEKIFGEDSTCMYYNPLRIVQSLIINVLQNEFNETKEGAEWFVITLLGGLGLLKQEARFTQQFEAKLLNGYLWEITSELEVRDRPTLSDGALAILLDNDFDRLSSAVNHLHYFVHVECPQYIEDL